MDKLVQIKKIIIMLIIVKCFGVTCSIFMALNVGMSYVTVWQDISYDLLYDQKNLIYTLSNLMDPAIEVIQEVTFKKIIRYISAVIMIFGGIIPYVPQYKEIYQKEDADGFSIYVCLALLLANTLRILFWFGKRYELPLLFQSIVMNIMMLAMIHLCVKVKNKNQLSRTQERYFTDFDLKYFWQWTDFQSYIDFLLAISVILSLITFVFIHSPLYIECIGFLALFTEAMLGVPQLLRNLRHRSTEGMSIVMVLMWTGGDAFKTIYFVIRQTPLQFWVCGTLQVVIDSIILGQVYWFRNSSSSFRSQRSH